MRTTLDLDEDVLQAAKELASVRGVTAGRVVSDLMRKALTPTGPVPKMRNGVPLLPRRPGQRIMTMKLVNELKDDE
ncbi:MAG: CopG family transcriptional regulator [Vicinamibacterales bacterium]